MIQRKQTLFLLAALIATVVCLCMPVATFLPQGLGASQPMYNLWVVEGSGNHNFAPWPLFAVLLFTTPINVMAIFGYKNRRQQARLCTVCIGLIVGWYIAYAFLSQVLDFGTFKVTWQAALPFVAFVCYYLARRGILADEALVRAADRIR